MGQQASQSQFVAAAEGGAKHHDAQIQQVAVSCVRTPGERTGYEWVSGRKRSEWNKRIGKKGLKYADDCHIYLLPSWKRANSSVVLSSTVRDVTVTGPLALLGKQPCSLTSCQSEWILQMSTESKYLREETDVNKEPFLPWFMVAIVFPAQRPHKPTWCLVACLWILLCVHWAFHFKLGTNEGWSNFRGRGSPQSLLKPCG